MEQFLAFLAAEDIDVLHMTVAAAGVVRFVLLPGDGPRIEAAFATDNLEKHPETAIQYVEIMLNARRS